MPSTFAQYRFKTKLHVQYFVAKRQGLSRPSFLSQKGTAYGTDQNLQKKLRNLCYIFTASNNFEYFFTHAHRK